MLLFSSSTSYLPHIVCLMRLRGGYCSHTCILTTLPHIVCLMRLRGGVERMPTGKKLLASHSVPYATQRRSYQHYIRHFVYRPHIVCLMRLRGGSYLLQKELKSAASHSVPYATQRRGINFPAEKAVLCLT